MAKAAGDSKWKHGMARTPTYNSWYSMVRRCSVPEQSQYERYGGRGISVCERWLDFKNFYEDMGERPINTTIDRVNNDGNYEPTNCRWATLIEQHSNTSLTVLHDLGEESKTLPEWCRIHGKKLEGVRKRISLGWSLEEALSRPINVHEKFKIRRFDLNGEMLTIPEIASRSGIHKSAVAKRLSSGMTAAQAIAKPYKKTPRKPRDA